MIKEVSIWLNPEKNDEEYLKSIIHQLARTYHSPVFIPHLTLCRPVSVDIDSVPKKIRDNLQGCKPVKLKAAGIEHCHAFFRAVFIQMI